MDDIVTLCMIGAIVLLGIALLPRLMRGFGGGSGGRGYYDQPGDESPRYDDPDIQSRGGFGGSGGGIFGGGSRSGGSSGGKRSIFGRSSGSASKGGSSGGARRYDNPNVKSRGGFGGSK
jgi:hypothetical protein